MIPIVAGTKPVFKAPSFPRTPKPSKPLKSSIPSAQSSLSRSKQEIPSSALAYEPHQTAQEYLLHEQKSLLDEHTHNLQIIGMVLKNPTTHTLLPASIRSILSQATKQSWLQFSLQIEKPHPPLLHPQGGSLLQQLQKSALEDMQFHQANYALIYLEIFTIQKEESPPLAQEFLAQNPPPESILRRLLLRKSEGLLNEETKSPIEHLFLSEREQAKITISGRYEHLMHRIGQSKEHDHLSILLAPYFLFNERTYRATHNSITGLENLGKHDCWINTWLQTTCRVRCLYQILERAAQLSSAVQDPSALYLQQIKQEADCFIRDKTRTHPAQISKANTSIIRHALHRLFPTEVSYEASNEDDPAKIIELLYSLHERIAVVHPMRSRRYTLGIQQTIIYPEPTEEVLQPNTAHLRESELTLRCPHDPLPDSHKLVLLPLNPHRLRDIDTLSADQLLLTAFIDSVPAYSEPRLQLSDSRGLGGHIKLKRFATPMELTYRFSSPPEELCFRVIPDFTYTQDLDDPNRYRVQLISHALAIPLRFTLTEDLSGGPATTYAITSFIRKQGNTDAGHYQSYQTDSIGQWHCCSDSTTERISEYDMMTHALPYSCMTFYTRLPQLDPLAPRIAVEVAIQSINTPREPIPSRPPTNYLSTQVIEWLDCVWNGCRRLFPTCEALFQWLRSYLSSY